MRRAASAERPGASPGRGARAARALSHLLVLLAGCLLLTACPPGGGDLVPLPRGEGASVTTESFEGDTLVVTREGLTLRARGRWSVADAATSVILDASNANAEPAVMEFGRGGLSREGGGAGLISSNINRSANRRRKNASGSTRHG